jgi:hypothetical protein
MTDITPPPAPPAKRVKRKRPPSRPQRWADAAGRALDAVNEIAGHLDDLETAVEELKEVQQEYQDWRDNLPENLANSPLGEKLNEVADLDLEDLASSVRDACDEAQGKIEEAEGMDLPRGFGKD